MTWRKRDSTTGRRQKRKQKEVVRYDDKERGFQTLRERLPGISRSKRVKQTPRVPLFLLVCTLHEWNLSTSILQRGPTSSGFPLSTTTCMGTRSQRVLSVLASRILDDPDFSNRSRYVLVGSMARVITLLQKTD